MSASRIVSMDTPKTILLISPYWKEPHRWMVSSFKLAELWQRLGYKVVVACMGSETGVDIVSPTLTIHRRKDIFLPDPLNFGIAFGFAGYVRRLARDLQPDLLIVNKVLFWTSFSLIPLRLAGYKVLLLTDALVGMTWKPRGRIPGIIMACGAWTVGWAVLKSAYKFVTFHPQPETLLKRLGVAHKTSVIPTGIDPVKYLAASPLPRPVRADGTVWITYVGRIESVKGVDDFLAAATEVARKRPEVRVRVVGWYKDGHPLVEKYRREVAFTGLSDDIAGELSRTDIFVLPSYSEGLSNALMEAMSSACACVASDVGGNRYLIQNGVSGLLFPAGDREALAAHLRRLLDDPAKRRSLAEAARKRILEHFSWETVGAQYKTLFATLPKPRV